MRDKIKKLWKMQQQSTKPKPLFTIKMLRMNIICIINTMIFPCKSKDFVMNKNEIQSA